MEDQAREALTRKPVRKARPPKKTLARGLMAMNVMLGMSRWTAAGLAAEAGWLDEVQPLWDRYVRTVTHTRTLLKVLDQVAQGSPATANRWLKTWLTGRKVPGHLVLYTHDWSGALPEGLDLEGDLSIHFRTLTALPPKLRIGRDLWLCGTDLRTLPPGLEIGRGLWIRGCRHWDGRIPADSRIGFRVFSDSHGNGLSLADWRAQFPRGERPERGEKA